MGPKKKKMTGANVNTPRPMKSQYLARIAEMNAVLAQLRRETFEAEELYLVAEKRYEQVQEDVVDIKEYLQHEITVAEDEISNYDRDIAKYNKDKKKQEKRYQQIYAEIDKAYEEKIERLTEGIHSMTAKLNTYEEIRRQREDYLKRRENLETLLAEMSLRHKHEMYEREKHLITEQDKLQKEMEMRLDQLALDLREATDVSIGETTNRIVGDNITLGNLLTCQQEMYVKLRENFTAMKRKQKDAALDLELKEDEYNLMFARYSKGAAKIEDHLQTIEETTKRIEELIKLTKINRRLKRMIVELECFMKDMASKLDNLYKSLEDVEEMMAGPKRNMQIYQKHINRLQSSLFEAAKKVKEAIDCEKIGEEMEETQLGEDELDHGEEAEKEKAYKTRELLIEEIMGKLQPRNLSVDELHQTTSSIEFHENGFSLRSISHSLSSKRSDFGLNYQNEEKKGLLN